MGHAWCVGARRERAYEEESGLDGSLVVHRSEIVLFDLQNHQLLKDLVAHEELLASTGDVSVVMKKSHA